MQEEYSAENTKRVWIDSELSGTVIGHAMNVHTSLGPGLLESAYKECLYYKLAKAGLNVIKEKTNAFNF